MKNWMLAIRPKTLFASVAPVLLGLTIAYSTLRHLNIAVAILTLICALFMQIASNLANDYLDSLKGIDTDERLGPTRVTHAGLIPARDMRRALIFTMSMAFIIGCYLMYIGGPFIIVMGLMSLYFAYGYTGGPFPLSYLGLGELAAFIFFGIVAVTGTTYLQTHEFNKLSLILGMGPGFISATILAVNNLRDIKTDTETKKRTLAVRFGENFQRKLCIVLIVLSSLLVLTIGVYYHYVWLFPAGLIGLAFIKNWIHIAKHPIDRKMNEALATTAKYLLVYCVLTSLGLLMSQGLLI